MTKSKRKTEAKRRKAQRAASIESGTLLGWRISEWCALTGTSKPTLWRHAKAGTIKLVYVGRVPIIPRSEAVPLGFLEAA
jgi:hypothetical protein